MRAPADYLVGAGIKTSNHGIIIMTIIMHCIIIVGPQIGSMILHHQHRSTLIPDPALGWR
jgi:hypothetical protein